MKYKVINHRQRKIDEQIAKERKKFINGTYIIAFIQMIITLVSAFYFLKVPIKMENMMKCVWIYFVIFLISWYFTKEKYTNQYFAILTNIYYVIGTLILDILFGETLGYIFQVVMNAGNGIQIIPAILIVLIVYIYSIISQMNETLKKHRNLISFTMAIVVTIQLFIVRGKLLTIIVDIIAVIIALLELKVDVKAVLDEYDSLTNKGKKEGINLLPFMIQTSCLLFLDMLLAIEEILKLGLDSKD